MAARPMRLCLTLVLAALAVAGITAASVHGAVARWLAAPALAGAPDSPPAVHGAQAQGLEPDPRHPRRRASEEEADEGPQGTTDPAGGEAAVVNAYADLPPPTDVDPETADMVFDEEDAVAGAELLAREGILERARRPTPRPSAPPTPGSEPADRLLVTTNHLLVGIDRRPGRRSGGRADTIMIAFVDSQQDRVGLLSIPRDLYVDIPGHGLDRINASLPVARRARLPELALLEQVLETTLQIPIHRRIALDLNTFERTIDILGGVTVHVTCPIRDNFIDPDSETGRTLLDVPAGEVEMNGKVAAMYARSRHGRSDKSRTRRQQAILMGIRDRLTSLRGLTKLPALFEEAEQSLFTDLSRSDMLGLLRLASRLDTTRVHGVVLGHRHLIPARTERGQSVVLPNFAAIDQALATLFDAPPPGTLPARSRCQDVDAALARR